MSDQQFSLKNLLGGLAFATHGSFSDPTKFAAFAVTLLDDSTDAPDLKSTITAIRRAIVQIDLEVSAARQQCKLGQELAKKSLIGRDLLRLVETAESVSERLLGQESISIAARELPHYARSLGLDTSYAELRVVPEFPHPHEKAQFAAMTYDSVDEKAYGIQPGVALIESSLQPLYSINLFAHELVHVAIGKVETQRLARGIEEGLADLVGMMLSSKVLGSDIAHCILINSRTRYGRNQLGRLYRDALIQACGLVLVLGEEGLLDIVCEGSREGREKIKELEEKSSGGDLSAFRPSASALDETQKFALRFLARSPDNVVSPLAVLIGESLKGGDNVRALLDRLGVVDAEGRAAIEELENRVYLAVESEGTVEFVETQFYARLGHLKYDL